jgi:hypothetical protein
MVDQWFTGCVYWLGLELRGIGHSGLEKKVGLSGGSNPCHILRVGKLSQSDKGFQA